MSYLLCFTQKKNQTLQENELEIPFSLKFYRFNFKSIKSIAQRLQPEFKKKIKSVQSQIEKVLLQSERTVFWMKLIQKFNILLIVAMIFGIYYMTLQGEDTSQDTFQAGVYILAATALLIILLQILCIFLWHYSFSQISHEVSLILLNETQRCGNQFCWRLSRDYTSIIFSYQATALLTSYQIYQNNEASSKSLFQQSNDNFNKKYPNTSRFMKEKKQPQQKINIYSHQDEEKVMVKNIGVISEANEQEIISAARINDDIHMENDKYSDGQKNPDQFTINLGVKKEKSKSVKEINLQEDQVVIEMALIDHTIQPSKTSHKSKASIKQDDKAQKQSKIPSQIKFEEVIKFNSDNEDEDEENFQQDLCSEKQSQEQQALNMVNISELSKTYQLSNQKCVLPQILEQQNSNSNRNLTLFNQSSNNQTEQDFNSGNIILKNNNSDDAQSPQSIKKTNSDETAKETKYKQSNFRNYINNGDDVVDNMGSEDDDDDHAKNDGQIQNFSSIQNNKFKAFKFQLSNQDSPQHSKNNLQTPEQNNIINQEFNLSTVKDPDLLSIELKTENSNKMINNQSQIQFEQDNQQNLIKK
ncbi:hypothetical protein ABPG72_012038 [Tetrahymena utriculariae]